MLLLLLYFSLLPVESPAYVPGEEIIHLQANWWTDRNMDRLGHLTATSGRVVRFSKLPGHTVIWLAHQHAGESCTVHNSTLMTPAAWAVYLKSLLRVPPKPANVLNIPLTPTAP